MPPWPPIGTPEDTKRLGIVNKLTDTGAIRQKLPGEFQICGTTLGLRCGMCQRKKRLPQALYSEDELPPPGHLTSLVGWKYPLRPRLSDDQR
ncbi:hypothetical protein N7516_006474 [Penicillium verrucosum]|uniref:uncharacterized protein n=1 Tax=Penicillium verrucosum TaxID=60171 RepID=UPI002544F9E5|nr:uncharacterized protein N7516_006474 [Penicillium verrucosum]KAJ5931985.1 hypothetical protein N7516_006474 [Penicillium verrucosum]